MLRLALKSSDWVRYLINKILVTVTSKTDSAIPLSPCRGFLLRMDTWESEQESWSETIKVLEYHRDCLESLYNANPVPDTPTKKRKLDHNSSPGTPGW